MRIDRGVPINRPAFNRELAQSGRTAESFLVGADRQDIGNPIHTIQEEWPIGCWAKITGQVMSGGSPYVDANGYEWWYWIEQTRVQTSDTECDWADKDTGNSGAPARMSDGTGTGTYHVGREVNQREATVGDVVWMRAGMVLNANGPDVEHLFDISEPLPRLFNAVLYQDLAESDPTATVTVGPPWDGGDAWAQGNPFTMDNVTGWAGSTNDVCVIAPTGADLDPSQPDAWAILSIQHAGTDYWLPVSATNQDIYYTTPAGGTSGRVIVGRSTGDDGTGAELQITGAQSFANNIVIFGHHVSPETYCNVNIGESNTVTGGTSGGSIALGSNCTSSANRSCAVGNNAKATATNALSLGTYSQANSLHSVAIGVSSIASFEYSTVIGYFATDSQTGTFLGGFSEASGNAEVWVSLWGDSYAFSTYGQGCMGQMLGRFIFDPSGTFTDDGTSTLQVAGNLGLSGTYEIVFSNASGVLNVECDGAVNAGLTIANVDNEQTTFTISTNAGSYLATFYVDTYGNAYITSNGPNGLFLNVGSGCFVTINQGLAVTGEVDLPGYATARVKVGGSDTFSGTLAAAIAAGKSVNNGIIMN